MRLDQKLLPYDADELAKVIPPPPEDIIATLYGVVGTKLMHVDAFASPGDSGAISLIVSGEDEV